MLFNVNDFLPAELTRQSLLHRPQREKLNAVNLHQAHLTVTFRWLESVI
jgi:hypothetical protein